MGNILWLASYPKSGNTWLRAFLANLVANRPTPLLLSELPQYCDDEARAALYTEASGKPSTELSISELSALRPAVQAGHQHCHAMATSHQRLAQVAHVVLDAAEHRVVVFVDLEDVHRDKVKGKR